MKRLLIVVAALCALVLAVGMGSALASGSQPQVQDQSNSANAGNGGTASGGDGGFANSGNAVLLSGNAVSLGGQEPEKTACDPCGGPSDGLVRDRRFGDEWQCQRKRWLCFRERRRRSNSGRDHQGL